MDKLKDELILSKLEEGSIKGMDSKPNKKIKTFLSNVFFTKDHVYKLYRRDNEACNEHFVNLKDKKNRFDFIIKDFEYNNYFTPDIYIALKKIVIKGEEVLLVDDAEEFYDYIIIMNKLDENKSLTNLLKHDKLELDDYKDIGTQYTKKISEFPKKMFEHKYKPDLGDWWLGMFSDLDQWIKGHEEYILEDEREHIISSLKKYVKDNWEEFNNLPEEEYSALFDLHGDNLFFEDGVLRFLDVYLVKSNWRNGPFWYAVYRVAADILIVAGKEAYGAYMAGARAARPDLNEKHATFMTIYMAGIRAPYLWQIEKDNDEKNRVADKYTEFIRENISKL